MDLLATIALTVLAVAGASIGVVAAVRAANRQTDAATSRDREQGLLRLSAEVHTGWEQTLIGLMRELHLPNSSAGLGYGELYLEGQDDFRRLVRSRSEIGRGFVGAIDLAPARGLTRVTYSILRLPGDENLHQRVLELELQLISALRRVDRQLNAQLAADALREFDRPRTITGAAPREDRPGS